MLKTSIAVITGTFGFVAASGEAIKTTTEALNSVSNPNAYIYGIIASGLIQIIIKLIEIKSKKKSL